MAATPHEYILMPASEVREKYEKMREGRTAQEVADDIGISRRQLFMFLKHGVIASISDPAQKMMDL